MKGELVQHIAEIIPAWIIWKQEQWKSMKTSTRPSEQLVEKICVECEKPVMVPIKTIRLKWGKNDWRHRECNLRRSKFQKHAW